MCAFYFYKILIYESFSDKGELIIGKATKSPHSSHKNGKNSSASERKGREQSTGLKLDSLGLNLLKPFSSCIILRN